MAIYVYRMSGNQTWLAGKSQIEVNDFPRMNLYLVRRFPSLRCVRTPLWPWCLIRCPNREYLLNGCQMVRNWGVKHVKIHIYIYYYYYNIYIHI